MKKGFITSLYNFPPSFLLDENDNVIENNCFNYFLNLFQINETTNTLINAFNEKYPSYQMKIKNIKKFELDDYCSKQNFVYEYSFENYTFKKFFNFLIKNNIKDVCIIDDVNIDLWFDDKLYDIIKDLITKKLYLSEDLKKKYNNKHLVYGDIILYSFSYNKNFKDFITINYTDEIKMFDNLIIDCKYSNIKYILNKEFPYFESYSNGGDYCTYKSKLSSLKMLYLTVDVDQYIKYIQKLIDNSDNIDDIKQYNKLLTISYCNLAKWNNIIEINI